MKPHWALWLCVGMFGCSAGGGESTRAASGGSAGTEDTGGTGGSATGGVSTGGTAGVSTGGVSTGGASTGGASTGGTSTGGASTGGAFVFTPASNLPASFDPPGGLAVDQVPQFIVLGFDDNTFADGMQWVLDNLDGRVNPAGNGNPATYDGQTFRATFYLTSGALDAGGATLLAQWQRAVAAGHEIGNHTATHVDIPMASSWQTEIDQCNSRLTSELGVATADIAGIRAPYLSFDAALFTAISTSPSLVYDCSVTHTPDDWENYRHVWPYTLDSGFHVRTSFQALGNFPGVWELPVYTMPRSGPARNTSAAQPMAGFDSTAYGTLGLTADAFLDSMKWALDLRLETGDNRAPLTIGLHSDTYSTQHTGYAASLESRRQAILDFIAYALTKPQVRFVSARQVIQWMSYPVAL